MHTSPLLPFFIITAILNLGLAVNGLRHRHLPGAIAFSLAMFLFACLPLSQAVNLTNSDLVVKTIALKIRVDMSGLGATAWFVMVMQFSGYSHLMKGRFLAALSIIPSAFLYLNWTENPLFRSGYHLESVNSTLTLRWINGPFFWVGLIYLNVLLLAPLYLLWRSYGRVSPLSFQQSFALSISIVLPLGVNLLSQVGYSPLSTINFPFAAGPVMGIIVAWAILRFHIFDPLPVARNLLIENMIDGVLVLDTQNRIIDINPAMQKMIGPSAIGQNVESALTALPEIISQFRDVHEARTEISIGENPAEYFDLRISSLNDRQGQSIGRMIVVRDITQYKQTENALRVSENNFRHMFESAPDAMLIVNEAGNIMFANAQSEKIFGYSPSELEGQKVEMLLPDRLTEIHKSHRTDYHLNPQARSMGAEAKWNLTALRKDGREIPVEISLSPLESDKSLQTMTTIRDISERKLVEQQLQLQAAALDASANAIVITDINGVIQWVNPAFTNLTGYASSEAIAQPTSLIRSGRHDAAFYGNLWNTIQMGSVWDGEIINRKKDGNEYIEHQTITPVRNEHGTISHFIAIKRDITEKKQSENALHEAEFKYRTLVEQLPAVVYIDGLDEAGSIAYGYVSPQIVTLLGYTSEVWEKDPEFWKQCLHPEDYERAIAVTPITLKQGNTIEEYRMIAQDGRTIWVRDHSILVHDVNGNPQFVQGFWEDITEPKQADIRKTILYETLHAVGKHLDLITIAQVAVETISRLSNWTSIAISIPVTVGHTWKTIAGAGKTVGNFGQVRSVDQGVIGRVYRTRQTQYVPKVVSDPDYFQGNGTSSQSELAVPIEHQNNILGVLNIESDKINDFNEQDISLAESLAEGISLALANAAQYAETQAELRERKQAETALLLADAELKQALKNAEILYDVTNVGISSGDTSTLLQEIVQKVAQGLPANRACLILFDIEAKKINHFIRGGVGADQINLAVPFDELMEGLSGWAIRMQQTGISLKDLSDSRESDSAQKRRIETNAGSIIVAPLRYQNHILGTITAINLPDEPDFTTRDAELLEVAAGQVASVINKINLEEGLQRKTAYLETLHQIAIDLLNRRDVDDLLNAIIKDATTLLEAPFGDLDIVEDDVMVTLAFTENQSIEKGLRSPRGISGFASWQVFDTREPVIINDYSSWLQRNPVFDGLPIHATIILPLISDGHCLGVFSLSRAVPNQPFTSDEIQLASLFAQQAALALNNAQLNANNRHELEMRKQTEEKLRVQNNYLAGLHDITLGLINRRDPDAMLEMLLTQLAELMQTDHALIDILDPTADVLIQKVALGKYIPQIGYSVARGQGLTGQIWEHGDTIVIPDYSVWESSLPEYRWIRTAAGTPMKLKDKVIGVIGVAFDTPDRIFTPEEVELLKRFANLASVTLDNAQLFSEAVRQSQELKLLHEVRSAIARELDIHNIIKRSVEAITETFGYTLVSLYLLERETLILQHQVGYDHVINEIPISKGILGRIVRTGESLLLEDVHSDPSFLGAVDGIISEVAVPIYDEGRVIGALNIESRFGFRLTEADMRLMKAVSDHIGVAIGRARLYERILRHNERLSQLQQITLNILKERNMDDLLQTITDQASTLLATDISYLALKDGNQLLDRAYSPKTWSSQMTIWELDSKNPMWQVVNTLEPYITTDHSSIPIVPVESTAFIDKPGLVLPLQTTETCNGVLGAIRTKSDVPFDAEDIQLGDLFARLAGLTIDNAQLHETLRQESIRDPLTGLFNRRFMEESLEKELNRARRDSKPLVVVMLDLDHFKHINDTYGHDGGDKVLQELSLLLKASVRGADILCRYGGEEFTMILPGASLSDALQRMEHLRDDIKRMIIQHAGLTLAQFTGSLGIAVYPEHGSTRDALLKAADEALYRAKRSGRDRIETA